MTLAVFRCYVAPEQRAEHDRARQDRGRVDPARSLFQLHKTVATTGRAAQKKLFQLNAITSRT